MLSSGDMVLCEIDEFLFLRILQSIGEGRQIAVNSI